MIVLEVPYKSLGERSLALHVLPASTRPDGPAPTAVFYHGGGWFGGSWRQFLPQAERLRELGMASVLVEYRLDGPVDATGFGREHFDTDEQAERYSPRHHVTAAFPPALIMHGTADSAVHHQNSVALADAVRRRGGGPAELILYPGQRHGFFNPGAPNRPDRAGDAYFERTTAELTRFLRRTVLRTAQG